MKLAISNIAWAQEQEPQVFEILKKYDVGGIELAPTAIFPDWDACTAEAGAAYRCYLEKHGFEVPALQSILFGRGDLSVFDSSCCDAFLKHIEQVASFAQGVGAGVLVFGSPKNRRRGQLSMGQAFEGAAPLLRAMGEICLHKDCVIGWEHNPIEYQCDFINNLADVCEFVDYVDHPGVRVHGDAGGLDFCGEPLPHELFQKAHFAHFHASAPYLDPISQQKFDYSALIAALRKEGYAQWLSIEMKRAENPLEVIEEAVRLISDHLS